MEANDARSKVFDTYYKIGCHLFEAKDFNEVKLTCEMANIHVALSTEAEGTENDCFGLGIWQGDKGETEGVTLHAYLDRDDAVRLAGLLMAWAETDAVHGGSDESQ